MSYTVPQQLRPATHSGCIRLQRQQIFVDTKSYKCRPRLRCTSEAVKTAACPSCFGSTVHRPLYGISKPRSVQVQAFRRPASDTPNDPAFSRSPVVDITSEPATTSGRDSDEDNSQQNRGNIIRRAAAAAAGILQSTVQWLRTHLKLSKLFDRYAPLACCVTCFLHCTQLMYDCCACTMSNSHITCATCLAGGFCCTSCILC